MAEDRNARPVSGEIMAGPPAVGARARRDAVDAEFETVGRAPAPAAPPTAIASRDRRPSGMDMLAAADSPAKSGPTQGGPLFWATGIALVVAAFWISGGHEIARRSEFFAAPAPARAVHIAGVTSRVDASGQRPLLFVDGEAVNGGSGTETLPPFDIVVTGNDGLITRYRLGTAGRLLAPGERFAFSSRLDVPKNGVKTVSVAFAE